MIYDASGFPLKREIGFEPSLVRGSSVDKRLDLVSGIYQRPEEPQYEEEESLTMEGKYELHQSRQRSRTKAF